MRSLDFARVVLYHFDDTGAASTVTEIVEGQTYRAFFGYYSAEETGADVSVYARVGSDLIKLAERRFEAEEAAKGIQDFYVEFQENRYLTEVSFVAEDSYAADSFSIEAKALTDDGRTLTSLRDGEEAEGTATSGADTLVMLAPGEELPAGDLEVVISSVLDPNADPIVLSGVQAKENGVVSVPLSDLEKSLEPGSYAFEFRSAVSAGGPGAVDMLASSVVNILPTDILDRPVAAGDFDGDRIEDVLFFNAASGAAGQFGMPNGSWESFGRAGDDWSAVGRGNFDSDDDAADVIWYNSVTGNLGRFDVDGAEKAWVNMGQAGAAWSYAGTADFNGDGTSDILWQNLETGNLGQFRISEGLPSWQGAGLIEEGWELAGVGDFNGDGMADILIVNTDSGEIGQFQTTASGKDWSKVGTMGDGWEIAATGDFNGDGTDDILVFNESSNMMGYYDMAGGEAAWVGLVALEAGWSIEGSGDFNGDGSDDLALRKDDGTVASMVVDGSEAGLIEIGAAGADWDIIL